MTWYQELGLITWLVTIGLQIGSIARDIEGIRKALGDPKPGSDMYGKGGFQTLAQAIREAGRR